MSRDEFHHEDKKTTNVRVDVHVHFDELKIPGVDKILAALADLKVQGVKMSQELDKLTTEVQEIGTVTDSAVALLNGLSARIEELKNDPVKLQALADELDSKGNTLAAAVAANTPAEPA